MAAGYHRGIVRVDTRLVGGLLVAAQIGCGAPPPSRPCPAGTRADDEATRTLLAALERSATGRLARARVGETPLSVCFAGVVRGTLRPDGSLVLAPAPAGAPGPAAARLAHLLEHLADGLHHFPAADVACDRQVEQAIAAEVRGISTELAVWRELDLPGAPFRFADAYWAAPAADRDAIVAARLRDPADPDDLDVIVRDYTDRCARSVPAVR